VAENGKQWFVVHTYSGHEERVKKNLEQRVKSLDTRDLISQVIIPTEEEIEVKAGRRRTVTRKILPGYVLVEMKLDENTWSVVRNTPGVTGFVGSGTTPTPLKENEVNDILKRITSEAPKVKVGFRKGQSVRVVDGPFIDFVGVVDEINMGKGKVKVFLSLFGQETPVELDFLQIDKL
jgi:transcription termination/antitermination protein NusG